MYSQAVPDHEPGQPLLVSLSTLRSGHRNENRNRYNEFVMCLKKTDGDDEACKPMHQLAVSICPDDWVSEADASR